MDKKDFENFSEQELEDLKDSIQDAIEKKRYVKTTSNMNTKGVAIAWIVLAILISLYRYFAI
jgi:hypothetical protein